MYEITLYFKGRAEFHLCENYTCNKDTDWNHVVHINDKETHFYNKDVVEKVKTKVIEGKD